MKCFMNSLLLLNVKFGLRATLNKYNFDAYQSCLEHYFGGEKLAQ